MKLKVERIDKEKEEAVIVQCHNEKAAWVQNIREAAFGQTTDYRMWLQRQCVTSIKTF